MQTFPIERTRPPSRVVYRGAGRHLELRPWSFGDIPALIAAVEASRAELKQFMPWAHQPVTPEGQYDLVARFQSEYWAGREYVFGTFGEGGEVLGGCGLHPRTALNPRALEVGYWCHSAHSNRGWTTLAARVLTALAFDRLGCDRVQVIYDEANAASGRVVEKCGFAYEGTLRNATSEAPGDLRAGGFLGTGRHRLYALTPGDLAALDWVADVREHVTLYDALGGAQRLGGHRAP